jgi:endonuclease YncB( thermonuclease family)
MTGFRPAALLLLLLIFSSLHAETLTGRVVRVTDGDTIVVLDADKVQYKMRLQGIDAQERHQAYGTKSKEHLSAPIWLPARTSWRTTPKTTGMDAYSA